MKIFSVFVLAGTMLIASCSKEHDSDDNISSFVQPPIFTNCLLTKIQDINTASDTITLLYNSNYKVIRMNSFHADTFYYSGNVLTSSAYTLAATVNPTHPYGKTAYTYTGGILSASDYSFSTSPVVYTPVTHSAYTFDATGRIHIIAQTIVNPGWGQNSHTTRYEYDANSNLINIFVKQGTDPEYLAVEYSNYDNKANPLYNLPWSWDYDLYVWSSDKLSKNNPGRKISSSGYTSGGVFQVNVTADKLYTYDYDSQGKITRRRTYNNSAPTTITKTEDFTYSCH